MNAYIDISDTVIKTERLTLRPWKNSDLDDFFITKPKRNPKKYLICLSEKRKPLRSSMKEK